MVSNIFLPIQNWLKSKREPNLNFPFFLLKSAIFRGNVIDRWTYKEFFKAFAKLYDPQSKIAVEVNQDILLTLMIESGKRKLPKFLKERYGANTVALWIPNFHRFYHVFDWKLQQLLEAGLVDYNMRYFYDRRNPKRFLEEAGPEILSLHDLEAGFVICMVPLVISIFIFVIEWLVLLKDFLVFRTIVLTFLELK